MKKSSKIILIVLLVVSVATVLVCRFLSFGMPEPQQTLLKSIITRGVCAILFVFVLVYLGYHKIISAKLTKRALLLCLPFIVIAINNFPYTAYFSGQFTMVTTSAVSPSGYIALIVCSCIAVGLFEELFFRGVVTVFFIQKYAKNRGTLFLSVLIPSAIFGLIHLVNLLDGAGVGTVFLQVGYSFLIGAMLSVCLIISKNVYLCAAIHALFNLGGSLITYTAVGNTLDTATICITAVLSVAVAVYGFFYLYRADVKTIQDDFNSLI